MSQRFRAVLLALVAAVAAVGTAHAQGVTTAALHGVVYDYTGEPVPGANVIAVHLPSGTRYGAATRVDGRYNLPNVRIGGPYRVTFTFVGLSDRVEEGIELSIGQDMELNAILSEGAVGLDEGTVTATSDPLLNSDRTGAATFVERAELEALPTISRSTEDFTRLTPQAAGLSFGGRNVLYNNFSLDGSIFNNPYGLDSPVPGGQTGAQPVSLEAVDQVQVSVAPYDVRQGGFTGAGINTVTKSGTNNFQVVAYTYRRNESLIGDEVAGQQVTNPDLQFSQTGLSIAGPILANKLFFYANVERERRDDPGTTFRAARPGVTGEGVSRVQAADLDAISTRLREVYGYETGPYEGYVNETNNDKLLVKLDWNVSQQHKASLRFNYLNAERQLPPHPFAISINNSGRGPNQNSLPFRNSGYQINNDIYSFVAEVNSRFSNTLSNNLIVGYTAFRDFRDAFSKPFPTLEIAENGVTYTTVGHEPFSINNVLDQNVFQLTDNLTFYQGRHTLTGGLNYEQFEFGNSFNLFYYGVFIVPAQFGGYAFDSVADFLAATDPNSPSFRDFNAEVATATAPFALAETNVAQAALYGQDEIQATRDLKVTVGLRVDMPIYFTDVPTNQALTQITFRDGQGNPEKLDVGEFPAVRPLFSPRVGANWDVNGDRSTQVRGGTGIFTGRLPFVWLGNQVSNQGVDDPAGVGTVNVTAGDFRWPQVWKTNVAVDQRLPFGLVGTLEGIYGKDLNAIYVRNANLAASAGTSRLDGRPVFPGATGGSPLLNANAGGAYVLDNTDEGYQYSLTAQLRRAFAALGGHLSTSLAYTFSEAKDVMTSTEIAQFVFEGNAISGNPNTPELAHSQFGLRHRAIGSAAFRTDYGRFGTTLGLFFETGQGDRFSYTYAGDLNGDGVGGNDLMFIPDQATDLNLVNADGGPASASAYTALDAFIAQDDYLSSHRSEIAERNGALGRWFTQVDVRLAQDIRLNVAGQTNRLQLSLDIQNVGNLINSDWGVRRLVSTRQLLEYSGLNAQGEPVFIFTGVPSQTFVNDAGLLSRWRAQFGIRYIFG